MDEFCEEFSSHLRCLSPDIENERYQDDACVTKTSVEQIQVEENVEKCIEEIANTIDINPEGPSLLRDKHIQFLKKGLGVLPASLEILDASRSWLCFWILHSLQLLDEPLSQERRTSVIQFLTLCQHPDGGFAGGPGQDAHLAPTYAAINALCTLRTAEAYSVINREKLLSFLLRMKIA